MSDSNFFRKFADLISAAEQNHQPARKNRKLNESADSNNTDLSQFQPEIANLAKKSRLTGDELDYEGRADSIMAKFLQSKGLPCDEYSLEDCRNDFDYYCNQSMNESADYTDDVDSVINDNTADLLEFLEEMIRGEIPRSDEILDTLNGIDAELDWDDVEDALSKNPTATMVRNTCMAVWEDLDAYPNKSKQVIMKHMPAIKKAYKMASSMDEGADYTDMQYGGKPITKDSRPFEKAVAGKERSLDRHLAKIYTPTDNDYFAGYRADKEKRRAQEKHEWEASGKPSVTTKGSLDNIPDLQSHYKFSKDGSTRKISGSLGSKK